MNGINKRAVTLLTALLIVIAVVVVIALRYEPPPQDEAKRAGKTPDDFPQTATRMHDDMDGGIELTDAERKGRNTWMLWTGGNQAFWDHLSRNSYGILDLLKTLSTDRDNRFKYRGLINEPGFRKATEPGPYGLWLDERVGPPPEDLDTEIYGRSSGVVGLRLYPNPNFDEQAEANWDPERYYSDPNYYNDPDLVRPYRVGMSCAFCHASFDPLNPPDDPENPEWENISANIGAEFWWVSRIFGTDLGRDNFVHQLMEAQPPGVVDTSLIASDNINGPRTMNSIFSVVGRLEAAERAPEKMAEANMAVPGVANGVPGVQKGVDEDGYLKTPHVLKDGADSVGLAGALARVYVNIGEFHQQWLEHFTPLIGGKQTPFDVESANENSVYWQSTAERLPNLAAFFARASDPKHLADAPGGEAYLTDDPAVIERGQIAFADHCASCHSSKQPEAGRGSDAYRDQMRELVMSEDFLEDNFLSTDERIPVTELGMNACASLATNAIDGHLWDAFSSGTYKELPAVGDIQVENPITGERYDWAMPGGGRGYLRVATLASLWASAPFFHNNSLGELAYRYDDEGVSYFDGNVASVDARMKVFEDAAEKLLWPEKRNAKMYRTDRESFLIVSTAVLPKAVRTGLELAGKEELRIGPIPEGTPISLLASIDMGAEPKKLVRVISRLTKALVEIDQRNLEGDAATERLKELVPDLLEVSKCPDFELNKGHTYGADLPDEDKQALIEYLKML